jgi:hypothetical protein
MHSPAMARAQAGVLRIDRQEPDIRIHLKLVVDGKPFDTSYERPSDGRRLRAVERIRGGGREQDNVWIFERKLVSVFKALAK